MGCAACSEGSAGVGHEHVEVRAQYASPELIGAIVYEGFDAAGDPRWRESGAADAQEYGYWCGRCCGMACLQMLLQHRDGSAPDLFSLLRGARHHGAYVPRDDGSVLGMIYAPFVDYIEAEFGLTGQVHPELGLGELTTGLGPVRPEGDDGPWCGRMVLASVHREIRRPELPAPGRGGHLVLVTGHDPVAGTVSFANPSGHTPRARAATLPVEVFGEFYAGRAVTVTLTR